jgi:large subunit ribosomal protein L18
MASTKYAARKRRRGRIRKRVHGSAAKPRLAVFRSNMHIYAQVIDDDRGHTLAAASSKDEGLTTGEDGKVGVAREIGKLVAERAKDAGIDKVVFDRGGNRYAGRVAAIADGAREGGLNL